jgi:2-polyprenyl-3-methyl-5-hydroxy-6-metoxy-1,4-benzoquinol methylase
MSQELTAFWNNPEMAKRMGDRPADHRFTALLADAPGIARVLDVGCAGGRNTHAAASRGLDVYAFDLMPVMVDATRTRLAEHVGTDEARRRVWQGSADDPAAWDGVPTGQLDLVLFLGVLQDLPNAAAFKAALSFAARALKPGGHVLTANFEASSNPDGIALEPVDGLPYAYRGFGGPDRQMIMPDKDTLDAWFDAAGFETANPTVVAEAKTDKGVRRTINAHHRLRP